MHFRHVPPPTRHAIVTSCPGLQASPTQVRDWLRLYLLYRGLDATDAEAFFWRGAELHRATYPVLVEAFKKHCEVQDWEADTLAYDIYTIVENSIPPPRPTIFQKYVEALYGYEFYSNLMQRNKFNPGFFDQANCIFCWIGLLIIHAVLGLSFAVIVGFLMNT
ncbi:hypothetical protein F5X99DRAFT_369408 [Biscogniauxia marginata]|nr:hypothetical protein F5X99DRAFT_369408 [Biscogniauxia marginata]